MLSTGIYTFLFVKCFKVLTPLRSSENLRSKVFELLHLKGGVCSGFKCNRFETVRAREYAYGG